MTGGRKEGSQVIRMFSVFNQKHFDLFQHRIIQWSILTLNNKPFFHELLYVPWFRGLHIIEQQNFRPASVDDVANIHARAYVSGLEKVWLFEMEPYLL